MISLGAQLRRVRRRLLGIGTAAAAVWGLAAVTILLLLGAWLDLLWEFSPRVANRHALGGRRQRRRAARRAGGRDRASRSGRRRRPAARSGRRRRRQNPHRLGIGARRMEPALAGQPQRALTLSLANIAVADAAAAAGQVPLGKVAPLSARWAGRSARSRLLWAAVAVLAICLPGLAQTQWNRFSRPYRRRAAVLAHRVQGHARATTRWSTAANWRSAPTVVGPPVEQLELVLEPGNRPGTAAADVSRGRRPVAGRAGQSGRADRLLRPRLSRPQREVSPRHHHRAADRRRPAADRAAGVCQSRRV